MDQRIYPICSIRQGKRIAATLRDLDFNKSLASRGA
jgi:hypothetical protein